MSSLQAALGLAELEEIDNFLFRKKQITNLYNKLLQGINSLELPHDVPGSKSINWQYSIIVKKEAKLNRDKLAELLSKNKIETRNFVIPLHKQPAFIKIGLFNNSKYPISEYLAANGLSIPSGLAIKDSEIKFVSKVIRNALL